MSDTIDFLEDRDAISSVPTSKLLEERDTFFQYHHLLFWRRGRRLLSTTSTLLEDRDADS
jgi:hypothetical protein